MTGREQALLCPPCGANLVLDPEGRHYCKACGWYEASGAEGRERAVRPPAPGDPLASVPGYHHEDDGTLCRTAARVGPTDPICACPPEREQACDHVWINHIFSRSCGKCGARAGRKQTSTKKDEVSNSGRIVTDVQKPERPPAGPSGVAVCPTPCACCIVCAATQHTSEQHARRLPYDEAKAVLLEHTPCAAHFSCIGMVTCQRPEADRD